MAASTLLEPTALSLSDQHTILRVTYDVVVATGDARRVVAKDQTSTVAVSDDVYARLRSLLRDVGGHMEEAVGLVDAKSDARDFLDTKTERLQNEDL